MRVVVALLFAFTVAPVFASGGLPGAPRDKDFATHEVAEVELGRLLFWDPILSGNRNISCGTCHHPRFGTSDGVALGLGEGGIGLGPARRADPANRPEQRVPRNAPGLFNLGHASFTTLFYDGRIEADAASPSGLRTPMGPEMEAGFAGALSAQTMFPVLSPDEMAGHYNENDVATLVRQGRITGPDGAWARLTDRVAAIPAYRAAFAAADPGIAEGAPIGFTDIADAIAAFVAHEWRADDSHFDRYLRGGEQLDAPAMAGLELFYGRAGCDACHAGPFQTDHAFHAMAAPQIGPGKAARFETHARDEGRFRVTGDPRDLYAFRTPSLRNVTMTGPWGHAGAHDDLGVFLRYHAAGGRYRRPAALLPSLDGAEDWRIEDDPAAVAEIARARTAPRVSLSAAEIDALLSFLATLTDPGSLSGRLGIPAEVPSALPVDR